MKEAAETDAQGLEVTRVRGHSERRFTVGTQEPREPSLEATNVGIIWRTRLGGSAAIKKKSDS